MALELKFTLPMVDEFRSDGRVEVPEIGSTVLESALEGRAAWGDFPTKDFVAVLDVDLFFAVAVLKVPESKSTVLYTGSSIPGIGPAVFGTGSAFLGGGGPRGIALATFPGTGRTILGTGPRAPGVVSATTGTKCEGPGTDGTALEGSCPCFGGPGCIRIQLDSSCLDAKSSNTSSLGLDGMMLKRDANG